MIGVKTLLAFSTPSKSSLLGLEALPGYHKFSRFYCNVGVVRRQSSPLMLLTRPCRLMGKRRSNFSSLKDKESEVKIRASDQANVGTRAQQPHLESATHANSTFLQRFLAPKEMPKRGTFAWYREMILICTVFAITGSSTMILVRPAVSDILGLKGSFKDGPWSYRICSLVIMTPLYATLLVCVGTIFGRHAYFRYFSVKILSRFGIPPELMDKSYHQTKQTFRKW